MGLRDELLARPRPSETFRLPKGDPTAAAQALHEAGRHLRQATIAHAADSKEVKAAKRKVAKASEALDACSTQIVLRAMPPEDFEALIDKHPATPEQRAVDPEQTLDTDTFRPALLFHCAEGDMTEEDWTAFFQSNVSEGERLELYLTALRINQEMRTPSVVLPKGLSGMKSLLSNLT